MNYLGKSQDFFHHKFEKSNNGEEGHSSSFKGLQGWFQGQERPPESKSILELHH